MQFISLTFIVFFVAVCLLYYVCPQKFRYIWLLFASYTFYLSINVYYVLILIISTLSTYICGRMISGKEKVSEKRTPLIMCIVFNVLILGVFKYTNFFISSAFGVAGLFGFNGEFNALNIILPVGISFYMFQALGYIIDVYNGKIEAEKNFALYALFVSFFPQIMSGPIERAGNMLPQFKKSAGFKYENMRDGLLLMMWGYFMKMVLADRMAVVVATVYDSYDKYYGTVTLVASILYTFEIYCDFAGYSNIAIGAAKVMGYNLMQNFESPYLSGSISGFWRRWHVSLSSWFRDYLYIPLGGNRRGTPRKYLNTMIVFAVSGLWHGANWTFVVWGLLHGFYQIMGSVLMPLRNKIVSILKIDRKAFSHKLIKIICTFMLVNIAWVFFRADTFKQAFDMIGHMFIMKPWVLSDGTLYNLGLDRPNFLLMIMGLIVLIVVDICNTKDIYIRDKIKKQGIWLRWGIYIAAVLFIITCGVWGPGYDSASFIYSQF
ncbi:MAG: MBOAT family protein [Butyrivibrio sp.]|nr:MBOAT family protein [Butyrivibrio sp.]